jgi:transcriptional regulator
VHIAGIVRLINDPSQTVALLEQMTSAFESPMSQPWQADYSTPRTTKLLESIVGFELDITAVTGKFKLSQNRPAADRANVIAQLSQSSRSSDQELAQFMMARPEK